MDPCRLEGQIVKNRKRVCRWTGHPKYRSAPFHRLGILILAGLFMYTGMPRDIQRANQSRFLFKGGIQPWRKKCGPIIRFSVSLCMKVHFDRVRDMLKPKGASRRSCEKRGSRRAQYFIQQKPYDKSAYFRLLWCRS